MDVWWFITHGGAFLAGLIVAWLWMRQPRVVTKLAAKWGIKDRVPLIAACAILPFLGGCLTPSTTVHTQEMPDGTLWTFLYQASAVSPNTVTVIGPDGSIETFATGSSMGQVAGPAAVAAAGYFIGDGLKEAPADKTNVEQSGGGASASAGASAAARASATSKAVAKSSKYGW